MAEPPSQGVTSTVKVVVERDGDTSQTSIVTLYTKEGSAKSGTDFQEHTEGSHLPYVTCNRLESSPSSCMLKCKTKPNNDHITVFPHN